MLFGNKIKKIAITVSAGQISSDLTFLDILSQQGYELVLGKTLSQQQHPYFATDISQRVDELHNFFADDSIDLILSCRGGYGSLHLLEHLNFEQMAKSQAYFIGYSDITILLSQLATYGYKRGLIAPMAVDLISPLSELTQQSLLACFEPQYEVSYPTNQTFDCQGFFYPMNLSSLQSLIGTAYMPNLVDKILCLEDINEPEYKIDKMLKQLLLSSDISQAKALILGEFSGVESNWFLDHIKDKLSIPIYENFSFSHDITETLALPFGRELSLKSDGEELTIIEKNKILLKGFRDNSLNNTSPIR